MWGLMKEAGCLRGLCGWEGALGGHSSSSELVRTSTGKGAKRAVAREYVMTY